MATQFKVKRVAVATFTPTTATTYISDTVIPAGALITAISINETVAFAGGTSIVFKVGSTAVSAVTITADVITGAIPLASSATGIVVATTGKVAATTVGTFTGGSSLKVYIEYLVG